MHRKIVLRSIRSRIGLYIPMIIAVTVTLCLIGASVIVNSSFHSIVDQQMAKYGANVILQSPPRDAMAAGVPIEIQTTEMDNASVQLATTSVKRILRQNPAWLVRGDGRYIVGQETASRLGITQGDEININGISGKVALLISGTQFDDYIFTDGTVQNPSLVLIRTDTPEKYRSMNAVILSEMVKSKYTVLASVGRLMMIMAIVSALASIATVINLARVDASKRQKEFGIFKSLGASGNHIARLISSEYLILSGFTILAGISGSLGLSWGIIHLVAGSTPQWNSWSVVDIVVITAIAFGAAGLTYIIESKRHRVAEELQGV